jgi:hypothetical protein
LAAAPHGGSAKEQTFRRGLQAAQAAQGIESAATEIATQLSLVGQYRPPNSSIQKNPPKI